ncbi:MAG: histidine kinase [Sphingobacteriales bacterium]|nr:histidine kinase [Sphingobacteriales bacterium]
MIPKKHTTLRFFWAVVLCGCLSSVKAQLPDYHLQLFDYTTGILPGGIDAVIKDKKGVLWILYNNRVQRFDGQELQTFRPDLFLKHIYGDVKGRVWVSAVGNVFLFSEKSGVFKKITVHGKNDTLLTGPIVELPGDRICLVTSDGLYRFDEVNQCFDPREDMPFLNRSWITNTSAVRGNKLFLHDDRYVFRYDVVTHQADSLPASFLYGIYPITDDSVLISPHAGMVKWYDFKSGTITPAQIRSENNAGFNLRNVVSISPGHFLLASSEGIIEYDAAQKEFFTRNFFIHGRKVATNELATSIFYDEAEGYAWISTVEGIARFAIRNQPLGFIKIKQMNDEISANIDDVHRMTEDKYGNLWMATGYGFACLERNKRNWKLFPPAKNDSTRLSHESVRGLAYDGKYLILGPTNTGVWLFDPATEKYRRPVYDNIASRQAIEKEYIDDITVLPGGDHLVTGDDAMYLLEKKTYRLSKLNHLHTGADHKSFTLVRSDGIVWIGSPTGLFYIDSALQHFTRVAVPAGYLPISGGFLLSNNDLLISSIKGLFVAHYANGNVTLTKKTTAFDNMPLQIIYQDNNGTIWAGSDKGLFRYDPATAKISLFDYSDNIQGYYFNNCSWYRDREGVLYFGGTNGINYWQPEKFSYESAILYTYISKARVGNKEYTQYTFNEMPAMKYSERSIDVVFAAAYFNNQEKVKYRYRLEGVDKDWKEIGKGNIVRFTSLSPGKYTLVMQAGLNQADWKTSKNVLSFQILAPFWLTWWFFVICALTLIGILVLIIFNHRRKIKEKQEELEAEQTINYFASSMYGYQSIETVLWDIAKNCISRLYFEDCVIYILDESRDMLVQKAAFGPKTPKYHQIVNPLEIPVGKGITGSVALSGKAEIVSDTSVDPRYIVDDTRRFSEISVPIKAGDKVLGIIDCEHSKKGFFTQRHLFILTTIASLCASKIIRARVEEQKQEAEKELRDTQQKMAEIEMQALRAQMNPHFIFNCLNSINRYIVKSDQATASLYLTRFAKLIRLILDNSNNKSVSLSSELEALRLYIEMESIRFEKQFTYSITVDKNVQSDYIQVPPLIIQPFVENAIWHGLLHKETAGHLTIHFSRKTPGLLECTIEDDGVGREKAKELKSRSTSTKKSLGMKLTVDRLSLLNKETFRDATVEILDLKNKSGEATGTKVVLKIPVDA